jgi:hypothetical protein
MKAARWPLLLCVGFAVAGHADALRCGTHLVSEGDSASMVAAVCGTPADVTRTAILRPAALWYGGHRVFLGGDLVEVLVETWLYNLGPDRLMRRVRFEDGRVVEIETLDYGYNP